MSKFIGNVPMFFVGAVSLAYGLVLIYPPAMYIWIGILLMSCALSSALLEIARQRAKK